MSQHWADDGLPKPDRVACYGLLEAGIYPTRMETRSAAARDVVDHMRGLLASQDQIAMMLASAASWDELLAGLGDSPDLDWDRVVASHIDEYIGLSKGSIRFSSGL